MKKVIAAALLVGSIMGSGCAYAGVAATADGKAIVARNDTFLFGILRKVFVCQVTPTGLAQCGEGDSP